MLRLLSEPNEPICRRATARAAWSAASSIWNAWSATWWPPAKPSSPSWWTMSGRAMIWSGLSGL